MIGKLCIVALLAFVTISQVAPPVWPKTFEIAFQEEFVTANGTFRTAGIMFYDATNNRSRLDRVNGAHDAFCNSLVPDQVTDCSSIVVGGKRYIYFPQESVCCYCCDSAHGCGILRPDWLNGAEYLGQENVGPLPTYKWNKNGDVGYNYYWATTDARRIPVKLDEGGKHVVNYVVGSYRTNPIDDRLFNLPSTCSTACPSASICGQLRGDKQVDQ